jgi:acetyltransferase-like isoleucine patch superfamily enzyme
MVQKAPVYRRRRYRPWLWPEALLDKFTCPVPWGLWFINFFHQRLLRINGQVPWMVHFTSRVLGDVTIGKNVWISFAVSGGCYIQGGNGIEIGDDTIFAPGVKIISANHAKTNLAVWAECRPIRIGKRCWIGANAIILPGVQLGDDVIVGAGSVVTRSFETASTVAGVPAAIVNEA